MSVPEYNYITRILSMNKKLVYPFYFLLILLHSCTECGSSSAGSSANAGTVTTFAGGLSGTSDAIATTVSFNVPLGVAVDDSGNVYVADTNNNLIRKITSAGKAATLAGSGIAGSANGTGTAASFNSPGGIAVDVSGNVYVADCYNNMIRKITSDGAVTTLAGSGTQGSANGTGTTASFNSPGGIAVDASGNVYVADYGNDRIRKISSAGMVSTLAGSEYGNEDAIGTSAKFREPRGVAVDASGNVYVVDTGNNRIRKITAKGEVTTLSGFSYGNEDGTTYASFHSPEGIAADASGNVFVADTVNNEIRKITNGGVVTTLAGSESAGKNNGKGTAAKFHMPRGVAVDASGNLYVADTGNNLIRKITSAGVVTLFAGISSGSANGIGTDASFYRPAGVAVDASGNLYIADRDNHLIRKITSKGAVTTLAGSGLPGNTDGIGTAAKLNSPWGIAVDASGNVYVADTGNHVIRKITAGVVSTLAGSGAAGNVNGKGAAARFKSPRGVAVDAKGNVYVADYGNRLIRKITADGVVSTLADAQSKTYVDAMGPSSLYNTPAGVAVDSSGNVYVADGNMILEINPSGNVTALAGSRAPGNSDGKKTAARFYYPCGLAIDAYGNIYIADSMNNRVRKISADGTVSTLAGSGAPDYIDGEGSAAAFNSPLGVAVDSNGAVYVVDTGNHLIRKIQ
jgi:sugar lactone lactonase YvrE